MWTEGLTENAGHEIAGQNIDDFVDKRSAETRAAARHKCDAVSLPEQTHLAAVVYSAAAGVAADVEIVPVAAAADAVAAGRSSASSSSLMDSLWCHID